ncbi:hypothetical protein LOAG_16895 [Loa loa]|uniref:Uncharacterized protein n=1 Tax=Loa loa TaxID=7209 RepID=A0A1S0UML2_LOALO|nr:hypothetical protein LOAG_16895 [Loa loa]EJD76087.1 hypothetical protein LOAG_16895 [Loa loa]
MGGDAFWVTTKSSPADNVEPELVAITYDLGRRRCRHRDPLRSLWISLNRYDNPEMEQALTRMIYSEKKNNNQSYPLYFQRLFSHL